MTQENAVAWAVQRIGQRIDYDGAYGAQCMDLVVALCVEGFDWRPYGNAIRLTDQALPSGWQRIRKSASFVPQPGDIAIWGLNEYATYGHTGIIESANAQTFVSIDQNWFNPSLIVGSPAARVQHNYYGFWGVLRPPYKAKGEKTMEPTSYEVARIYAQKILFRDMDRFEWEKFHSAKTRDQLFDEFSSSDEWNGKWQLLNIKYPEALAQLSAANEKIAAGGAATVDKQAVIEYLDKNLK